MLEQKKSDALFAKLIEEQKRANDLKERELLAARRRTTKPKRKPALPNWLRSKPRPAS